MEAAHKDSYFAKGIRKARLLRVFENHKNGITTKFDALDDLDKEAASHHV